jgi:PilZ domain
MVRLVPVPELRRMRPRSHIERRRNPRIATPHGVSASWKSGESNIISAVGDFSISGAFISLQQAVPLGTRLSLMFSLPEGDVHVQAIVRNYRAEGGIGVEFVSMGARDFDLVLRTFRRLLGQTSPASQNATLSPIARTGRTV